MIDTSIIYDVRFTDDDHSRIYRDGDTLVLVYARTDVEKSLAFQELVRARVIALTEDEDDDDYEEFPEETLRAALRDAYAAVEIYFDGAAYDLEGDYSEPTATNLWWLFLHAINLELDSMAHAPLWMRVDDTARDWSLKDDEYLFNLLPEAERFAANAT